MASKPALIINLDINKTVILVDAASGSSLDDVLNSKLATAWGIAERKGGSGLSAEVAASHASSSTEWLWRALESACLTVQPPALSGLDAQRAGAGGVLCTYEVFLKEMVLPYRQTRHAEDGVTPLDDTARAAAIAHNRTVRGQRKTFADVFTHAGQPGERFGPQLDVLKAKLTLTPEQTKACAAAGMHFLARGIRYLLPAYFQLLQHLVESGRNFVIAFRTFGHDIPDVITEHNAYCAGTHPLYPLPEDDVLQQAIRNLAIQCPHGTGTFVRHGDGAAETHLCTVVQHGNEPPHVGSLVGYHEVYSYFCDLLPFARSPRISPAVHSAQGSEGAGALAVHAVQEAASASGMDSGDIRHVGAGRVVAVRDHYEHWFKAGEKGHAGKLMPFEPSDTSIHCMFFDDNCGGYEDKVRILNEEDAAGAGSQDGAVARVLDKDCGIVDARVVSTGHSLPWSSVRNKYLVAVDNYSAVLNDAYFIHLVRMCERNVAAAGQEHVAVC